MKQAFLFRLSLFAGLAVVAGLFAYVVSYQSRYTLIADNAIMVEFARRLLEGGLIVRDFADPNFPQSYLLYLPVPLLGALSGLPLYILFPVYIYGLAAGSALLVWRLLRAMPFLSAAQAAGGAALYLCVWCLTSGIHLGERDPVIFLGLLPLLLVQHGFNKGYDISRILFVPALFFGTFAILIKPHYGLMPFVMLVWFLIRERKVSAVLTRPDFLVLSCGTLLLAAVNLLFFAPYYRDLFADNFMLYAAQVGDIATPRFVFPALFFTLAVPVSMSLPQKETRSFCLFLCVSGFCLLAAYLVQAKGLFYHLIPIYVLAALTGYFLLALTQRGQGYAGAIAAGIAVLWAVLFPVNSDYTTHGMARTLPVAAFLQKECVESCTFFMSNEYNFIAYETALYTGARFGSRFSSLWFEPPLACAFRSEDPGAEAESRLEKYAGMMAEDLERYKPSLVILYTQSYSCPDGGMAPPAFPALYKKVPAFAQAWGAYRKGEPFTFNRRAYFPGTDADYDYMMTYDVYRRE